MGENNTTESGNHFCWLTSDGMGLQKCFISGRWCIFEREISKTLKQKTLHHKDEIKSHHDTKPGEPFPKAFVIMPLSEPFGEIFRNQIRPMLSGIEYPLDASRADTVMRTGYVMCEKICKQIQEADLVVAEITIAKQNVLYELGLAAGLGRRILFMAQKMKNSEISFDAKAILSKLDVKNSRKNTKSSKKNNKHCISYAPFSYIKTTYGELSDSTWTPPIMPDGVCQSRAKIGVLTSNQPINFCFPHESPSAPLGFCQLEDILKNILGSVTRDIILKGLGLDTEEEHEENLRKAAEATQARIPIPPDKEPPEGLEDRRKKFLDQLDKIIKDDDDIEHNLLSSDEFGYNEFIPWMVIESRRTDHDNFGKLASFVESCECIVVDVSENADPINFFWLGYSHAKGKSAIPVTMCDPSAETAPFADSPFDVRGLWHVHFDIQDVEGLKQQFYGIMKKILDDNLNKMAKRKFWAPFLNDVEIQIIVGAKYKQEAARYMVGEWDYMTLAELVGYLSKEKPTLKINIANPVYSDMDSKRLKTFEEDKNLVLDKKLKPMIEGKNCIIIASPDANIVTEMALAKAKNVCPFDCHLLGHEDKFTGFVGYKDETKDTGPENRRGFMYWKNGAAIDFSSPYSFKPREANESSITHEDDQTDHYTFFNSVALKQSKLHHDPIISRENLRDKNSEGSIQGLYGYMAVFKNPYTDSKKILILSGIGGPATVAMAQILTGRKDSNATINKFLGSENDDDRKKGRVLLKKLCNLEDKETKAEKKQKQKQKQKQDNDENQKWASYGVLANRIKPTSKEDSHQKQQSRIERNPVLKNWIEDMKNIIKEIPSNSKNINQELEYSLYSEGFLNELNREIDAPKKGEAEALVYVVIGDPAGSDDSGNGTGGGLQWEDARTILLWGFANCTDEDCNLKNPKTFDGNINAIKDRRPGEAKTGKSHIT